MTVKGCIFLMVVTMAAVAAGAAIGDQVAAPGLERTLTVALVAAPIVFLAGIFAERRGWVSGHFDFGRRGDAAPREQDAARTQDNDNDRSSGDPK